MNFSDADYLPKDLKERAKEMVCDLVHIGLEVLGEGVFEYDPQEREMRIYPEDLSFYVARCAFGGVLMCVDYPTGSYTVIREDDTVEILAKWCENQRRFYKPVCE